jgi:hypothetical protein
MGSELKTARRRSFRSGVLPAAALLALLIVQTEAFAALGLLTTPGIAVPKGSPVAAAQRVVQAPKYKFVTGMWLNSFSTLFYTGNEKDLALFVNDLTLVKGAEVNIRFSKSKGWADTTKFDKAGKAAPCQWRLSHIGNNFGVTVYLGDGKIDIEKLQLPPLKPDPSTVKKAGDAKP